MASIKILKGSKVLLYTDYYNVDTIASEGNGNYLQNFSLNHFIAPFACEFSSESQKYAFALSISSFYEEKIRQKLFDNIISLSPSEITTDFSLLCTKKSLDQRVTIKFHPIQEYLPHSFKYTQELLSKGYLTNFQDHNLNNAIHNAGNLPVLKTLLSIDSNLTLMKNVYNNNPTEHFLHQNSFALAASTAISGEEITRTLGRELEKELDEFIDMGDMHPHRYQMILNILHHRLKIKNIPDSAIKYIDSKEDLRDRIYDDQHCMKILNTTHVNNLLWIKNYTYELSEYFFNTAKERQLETIDKYNTKEIDIITKLYQPHNSLKDLEKIEINIDDSQSYMSKLLKDGNLSPSEIFVHLYSDVSHTKNSVFLEEGAIINEIPLAHFNTDFSVYRGMTVTDLDTVQSWFKYGYQPSSCKEFVPSNAWVQPPESPSISFCRDEMRCTKSFGTGLLAGVVYTSTSTKETMRFAKGFYTNNKYSIIQEIKISDKDLHLSPQKFESAIHFGSILPNKIVAAYVVTGSMDIEETIVNPYITTDLLYPILKHEEEPDSKYGGYRFNELTTLDTSADNIRETLDELQNTEILGDCA